MAIKNKHTKEFKQDAVNLITQKGCVIREAGRNLGIHEVTLRCWEKRIIRLPIRKIQIKKRS